MTPSKPLTGYGVKLKLKLYVPKNASKMLEKLLQFYDLTTYQETQVGWFWVVPAIMAAAGLVNSLVQRNESKKSAQRTAAANMALADKQFAQNRQMVQEQNAYNDPQAQMMRLQGAGLNPNLIYGSGASGASGSQTSVARAERPTVDMTYSPLQIPTMLGEYQNFQMRQAQINNVKAQTSNIEERTATESVTRFLRDVQGKKQKFDLGQAEYLAPYQAAIVGNKARSSEATLLQEWQKLSNLSRDEQLKMLVARQKEKGLELQDVEKEQREAELLFQRYKNEWAKAGVTSSDNIMLRMLIRMLNEQGFSADKINPFK